MNVRVAHTTPEASPDAATVSAPVPSPTANGEGPTLPPNGHSSNLPPIIDISSGAQPQTIGGLPRAEYMRQYRARQRAAGNKPPRVPRNLNPPEPGELKARDGGPMQRQSKPVDYHAMALMCVGTVTGVCEQFGGAEWRPSDDEHKTLTNSTETYLRAKEFPDLPPGWVLTFVVCAYALPRLNSPTMRERLGRVGDKIKGALRIGPKS